MDRYYKKNPIDTSSITFEKMNKEHTKKCASNKCKYDGDMRNRFPDEMRDCDCDGYHTFDELYDHRIELFICLCKFLDWSAQFNPPTKPQRYTWRSKLHHDETSYKGWFILGVRKETGKQISYHLPISRWDDTAFAETLDLAPEWDGHTSDDVIERLKKLL